MNPEHGIKKDLAVILLLVVCTILLTIRFVDFSLAPFEDAAILMRYSQHCAQGHGIVWNIGEKPVDGATDLLFMITLGAFLKTGLPLETAARGLIFSAHLLTVIAVFLVLRRRYSAPTVPAALSALYLAAGAGLSYLATCFGTPFFALFALLSWYAVIIIMQKGVTHGRSLAFALLSLVTALIRPEGVFLTGFMLVSLVYFISFKKARLPLFYFFGLFLALGGAYFLWRWNYFGYPLPNPFYKKGGGHLYPASLKASIVNVCALGGPFILAYVLGFFHKQTVRQLISYAIPVVGFTLLFVLLSNEMNFGRRFQYALLPIMLVSWWPLVSECVNRRWTFRWSDLDCAKKLSLGTAFLLLVLGMLAYQTRVVQEKYHKDGRYEAGRMLSAYKDLNYVIATTEAGNLPLYSGWRAIDTWGLNDQWIAHNGAVTEEYLDQYSPEVIAFNCFFSEPLVPVRGSGKWNDMVMTLKSYAEKRHYLLAAAFGESPYFTHHYYVKPDFPESAEIVSKIRCLEYAWNGSGRKCINFASCNQSSQNSSAP